MPRIFPEYKRSTVYALVSAVFHLVVVVLPFSFLMLGDDGYGGKFLEVYYYFVWFVVDFPFMILNSIFSIREILKHMGMPGFVNQFIFLAIAGTIFYALAGWFIGYLTDKNIQLPPNKTVTDQDP